MKCQKCRKDFCMWNELCTRTYMLMGFGGKLFPTEKTACLQCAKVYEDLEKQSMDSVKLKEDVKIFLQELENNKIKYMWKGDTETTLVYRSTVRPNMVRYYNFLRSHHHYNIDKMVEAFESEMYIVVKKIKKSSFW